MFRGLGNGGQINGNGGYASQGKLSSRDFQKVVTAANILMNKQMNGKQAKAIQKTLNLHTAQNAYGMPASYYA